MITCKTCGQEFHGWWMDAIFAGWLYVEQAQEWFCPACKANVKEGDE